MSDSAIVEKLFPVPETSVSSAYSSIHLADAYAVILPAGASNDPEVLARFMLGQPARWMTALMTVRDALAGAAGLKTARLLQANTGPARAPRIGMFRIYATHPDEIILGEDDRHLDFRISVLLQPRENLQPRLVVSTVVHCHNVLGRIYLALIGPFHRMIVPGMLKRAARAGWPAQAAGPV
jgi:hypothetical protein